MKRRSFVSAAVAVCAVPVNYLAGILKTDAASPPKRRVRYELVEDQRLYDSYYRYPDGDAGPLCELPRGCSQNLVIASDCQTGSIVGVTVILRNDSYKNTLLMTVVHLLADSHDVRVGMLKAIAPCGHGLVQETEKRNYCLMFNINNADTESQHTDAVIDAIYDSYRIRAIELGETSCFRDEDYGVTVGGFLIKTSQRIRTKVGFSFIKGDDGIRGEDICWGRKKSYNSDYMKAKLTAIAGYFHQSSEHSQATERVRVAVAGDSKYKLAGDKNYRTGYEIWT